jgi:hypothetical protein
MEHPVDELAQVRAERRRLAQKEEMLRQVLLRDHADLVGADYQATVQTFERQEIDRELLVQRCGHAVARACEKTVNYRIVSLAKRPQSARPAQAEAVQAEASA